MFGWFRPRCPVQPRDRAWTEARFRWLAGEFGLELIRTVPIILPTPEFFPEPYSGTEEDGQVMFRRVCRYMRINPDPMRLEFFTGRSPDQEGYHEGAAGLYQDSAAGVQISTDLALLKDPLCLVATLAHELGHLLLLGQGRLLGTEEDHEQLTDLLTVALGLGVFTANSRIRSSAGRDGLLERWSIRRLGYLSQLQVGYALALFAQVRGEKSPAWAKHLCADVRAPFKQGLRYLLATGSSLFDPVAGKFADLSDDELPPGFAKR